MPRKSTAKPDTEPKWPGFVALMAVATLRFALPPSLFWGPHWLTVGVLLAFLIPKLIFMRQGNDRLHRIVGHVTSGLVTVDMVGSLGLLISRLPSHKETPQQLLIAASLLWISNVLVFASWYWRLDAGGPTGRDSIAAKAGGLHVDGAFLFPQMTMQPELLERMGEQTWRPGFIDYLFLAFNTSTAFSPTDVPVLSRWAKVLMIVQASISFATVVIIAARAINTL